MNGAHDISGSNVGAGNLGESTLSWRQKSEAVPAEMDRGLVKAPELNSWGR